MNTIANFCMLSYGWRRAAALVVAGAIGGLSVPPLFILPALFFALPIWIWCLDGAERGQGWRRFFGPAFLIGFWFGLGYFTVAIHWVGAAFFVDGGWVLAMMPFAVLSIAAILALFWAIASAAAHLFWHHGATRILHFAVFLTAAEFARGHFFTGFPFDLLGYALAANEQMIQLASVVGVYGLTLIAVVVAATPALIWPADKRNLSTRLAPFFGAIMLLVGQLVFGQYRLEVTTTAALEGVRMRLVQPNIQQSVKWQANSGNFILDQLISLSEAQLGAKPDSVLKSGLTSVSHVVWPESAFPFFLSENPEALARIARMLPSNTTLLTGAPWRDPEDVTQRTAYNAVLAINSDGEIISSYAKTHLVPFGEYLPYAALWDKLGIKQFVPGGDGWTPGNARRLMAPDNMPGFLPLVCYEVVFSGDLGEAVDEAAFILNVTNDGWFDGSIGPAQHFHHARLRAVEEGKALVRVANTGLTAAIDPLGRTNAALLVNEVGLVDVVPQQPLAQTWFAKWRHWPLLFSSIFLLFLSFLQSVRRAGSH